MPQKKAEMPPEVMTWGKAVPVLLVCLVFDAVRFLFEQFWFFGPALAAAYCTAQVSDTIGTGLGGALCSAVALAAGTLGSEVLVPFGVVMAIAVGLLGWLVIGLWLTMTNARIFKENGLWFVSSLLIAETPLLGTLPALTGIVGKMYYTQIKKEKAELRAYQERHEAEIASERALRAAQFTQARSQDDQQGSMLDEQYTQEMQESA